MEASSPLAAMQPSSAMLGHYGLGMDASTSYASYAAIHSVGPDTFNFRDLSMKSSQEDYFHMKPVRGSSPTASLAADLSQNCHIDQSPQLPTPRRALFANTFFGSLSRRGHYTTASLPSSSPGPASDSMEISPLPHKPPFGASFQIRPASPTRELTPIDSSMLSIPSPPAEPPFEPVRLTLPQESVADTSEHQCRWRLSGENNRRRPSNPLRPSLSRAKGLSTTCIPQKPTAESRLPTVKFGNGVPRLSSSASMNLSEAFVESPLEKSILQPNPVMGPPRSKPAFAVLAANVCNGSPVGGHIRKNSNPLVRPRKQFRRSLSMFEHPEDVMKQEKSCRGAPPLPSVMDVETAHVPQLPHFNPEDQVNGLPRITRETLIHILDGKFNHLYEKLVVIDCRFEYEYNGGHINGAVNFNDKEQLSSQLFEIEPTSKALLILHCEYSAHRAPIMAEFIRNKDRAVNSEHYPHLTYPETYILDGGYSSFFMDYRSRCFPENYVEMHAKEHSHACEKGLGRVKQRSKLMRAQTFAFGQHSPSMEDSPTGTNRTRRETTMDLEFGSSMEIPLRPVLDAGRFHTRRMFSY